VADSRYSLTPDAMRGLLRDALDAATALGASGAAADFSESFGQSVSVRMGEVETIEYNRDKDFGITVYFGQQRGHASSSDLSPAAIRRTVEAACSIARYTAMDEAAGLPEPELLARGPFPDLDLYHPSGLEVERAIEWARDCEAAALAVDKCIDNSDGATVYTGEGQYAFGNSLGFLESGNTSHHSVVCSVIAREGETMERDYWYTESRDIQDLDGLADVGRRAGQRAVARLGARKLKTMQVPVLFEANVSGSLIGHLVSAASGGNLYRKSSFLTDSIGRQVLSKAVTLSERPHLPKGLGSTHFDSEGVATHDREVVSAGVLQGYFLGTYSARKLGLKSTGNAGGNHNLILADTGQDFRRLLAEMGRGLLVTELLGHGVNLVSGDYSRGAAGFWVENGEILYPVQEITIAGNLKDMFMGIVAVGNDVLVHGSRRCGSILLERMTVAGD
jgi:PmbA protein